MFNYHFFAPRYYPVRFNRKTGKVYFYHYVLSDWLIKCPNSFWYRYPFYKRTSPEQKEFYWQAIQGVSKFTSGNNASQSSIMCMVHDFADNRIIDSFKLISTEGALDALTMNNLKLWLWVNNYMMYNDEIFNKDVLPPPTIYGRAVIWRADIDRKSKLPSPEA